jgi:hypothetical protein
MATQNRFLHTVTEPLAHATHLLRLSQALAQEGTDDEKEALQLEEVVAAVRGWREHIEEKVRRLRTHCS